MNINWKKVSEEAVQILTDLIRINTSNPPGAELPAALYLKQFLDKEGIEATIFESAGGRGNLIARLRGTGTKRPLLLLSHLDVVGANAAQWRYEPFGGTVADGYVWGRGALDMKGMITMELLALALCKRQGLISERDLIMVAAADEEAGANYGMEVLMQQDIPGLKEAEYVINEGGEGTVRDGIPVYACQNGEKGILWVKLKLAGTPGHASVPNKDNAILHMTKILNRLERLRRPMTLSDTTRAFLSAMAKKKGVNLPTRSSNLDYSLKIFASRHFKQERTVQAMLYNTVSPTVIRAGEKANVLPDYCEVTLDCRLIPGQTAAAFLEELRSDINDSSVELEVIHAADPTESNPESRLFQVLSKVVTAEHGQALVVPYLSPGGTDSRYFRKLGITAYGFMPILISETELDRMHGIDERLSVENLERGTRILFGVLQEMAQE